MDKTIELLKALWTGGNYAFLWSNPDRRSWWLKVSEIPEHIKPTRKNLYFGVHPVRSIPTTNSRGEDAEPRYIRSQLPYIQAVNCLFADFDAKDYDDGKNGAINAVRLLTPPPSVIVDSGGGYHAYWLLNETLMINDGDMLAWTRRLQWRWVKHVGGDPGAKDLCRVLRVPGSRNYKEKYAPDYPEVKFVRWINVRYSLHDLTSRLPPEPVRKTYTHDTRDAGDVLSKAIRMVLRSHEGHRNDTLNKAAFWMRDRIGSELSHSEAEDALLKAASDVGLPENEALATIRSGLGGVR